MNPVIAPTPGDDLQQLQALLEQATAAIAPDYFLLPVATPEGAEPLTQYRERVYAYELYHQLRSAWPRHWRYSLAGEADKTGHPIVRGAGLDNKKPDLLVHVPQSMQHNLAIIEIKALRAHGNGQERKEFQKDIKKLIAFRGPVARYAAAFFLIFGDDIERVKTYIRELRAEGVDAADLNGLTLLHHPAPRQAAVFFPVAAI